jgi:hypothetical protein
MSEPDFSSFVFYERSSFCFLAKKNGNFATNFREKKFKIYTE